MHAYMHACMCPSTASPMHPALGCQFAIDPARLADGMGCSRLRHMRLPHVGALQGC